MVIAESALSKTWITSRIKVTAVFLLSGLLSGLVSVWLSSTPRLRGFLFVQGDKFLIPTYKFWTVFALVFSIALVVAYFLSRCPWLADAIALSRSSAVDAIRSRRLAGCFVFLYARKLSDRGNLLRRLLASRDVHNRGPFASARVAVLQSIFVLIAALIVMYVVLSLINGLSELYEYVQTGIAESLFAAAFGSWLTWTPRRFYERTA
jgi:hypothetical protein